LWSPASMAMAVAVAEVGEKEAITGTVGPWSRWWSPDEILSRHGRARARARGE
jgi:hypothetical protein